MARSRTRKGAGKHRVVSHKAWIEARRKFLAKEKKFTRLRDELARQRRTLPWEKVDKQYVFDGQKGKETLAELFDGSSGQNDFNYDYQASFTPQEVESGAAFFNYSKSDVGVTDREGVSVFLRDKSGTVFHTYSSYARGIDMLNTAYHYLDLVPKGRDEDALEFTQSWVRYHDKYEL